MSLDAAPFVHDFRPGAIRFGRGSAADLGDAVVGAGGDRALVVCGTNVGANRAVMDPVEAGLGDHLAGVFDRTTPDKRLETAVAAARRFADSDADTIVGLGSGSSLDLARFVRLLAGADDPPEAVHERLLAGGAAPAPSEAMPPLVVVPTTLAGADMSVIAVAGYEADGAAQSAVAVDPALMPSALLYDPALFETTPQDVLAGSAMNGFDKALECAYAATGTPVTDATAVRALRYLRPSLPDLGADPAATDRAVVGTVLAQYGVSDPGGYKLALVHAFGHGLRDEFGLQQGVAHAVVVPHALELLFDRVDGRRDLLAEGLGVDATAPAAVAAGVVDAVTAVRDGLGLPSRLRDLEGTDEARLRRVAERTHADAFMANCPDGFDPTVEALETVLRAAW